MESNNKDSAILFGPFSGELSWEFYRFAPYLIYLKRINPDIKTIVYSRAQRIDLSIYRSRSAAAQALRQRHGQRQFKTVIGERAVIVARIHQHNHLVAVVETLAQKSVRVCPEGADAVVH